MRLEVEIAMLPEPVEVPKPKPAGSWIKDWKGRSTWQVA
jgi:hypothetical protein